MCISFSSCYHVLFFFHSSTIVPIAYTEAVAEADTHAYDSSVIMHAIDVCRCHAHTSRWERYDDGSRGRGDTHDKNGQHVEFIEQGIWRPVPGYLLELPPYIYRLCLTQVDI